MMKPPAIKKAKCSVCHKGGHNARTCKAFGRAAKGETNGVRDRAAHHGYLIVKSLLGDTWYISKDGYHITSTDSLEAAKTIINEMETAS